MRIFYDDVIYQSRVTSYKQIFGVHRFVGRLVTKQVEFHMELNLFQRTATGKNLPVTFHKTNQLNDGVNAELCELLFDV